MTKTSAAWFLIRTIGLALLLWATVEWIAALLQVATLVSFNIALGSLGTPSSSNPSIVAVALAQSVRAACLSIASWYFLRRGAFVHRQLMRE